MRLFLWFTLFTICSIHLTQAGIYRRYVRRNRPRPPPRRHHVDMDEMMMIPTDRFARREYQFFVPTPWPAFLYRSARSARSWAFPSFGGFNNQQPRMNRRFRQPSMERQDTVPNFHHQPTGGHHYPGITPRHPLSTTPYSAWRPLDYGNPIGDPTFDYAPPSVERVRFHSENNQNRRTTARSNTLPPGSPYGNRPPPPPSGGIFSHRPSALWKMLAHKQRPQQKRPYPPRGQGQSSHHHPSIRAPNQGPTLPYHHHQHNQVFQDEAEIFPRIPNMVFFRPNDVVSSRPGPQLGFPPRRPPPHQGHLGQGQGFRGPSTSSPHWSSINNMSPPPQPNQVTPPPHQVTSKPPTILHAVKTTPVTITTTHNSVGKPFEPTESLDHTSTHVSFHEEAEEDEESAEESEQIEKKSPVQVKDNNNKEQKVTTKQKTSISQSQSTTFSSTSAKNPVLVDSGSGESTEDKLDMVPPAPIFPNSFNILDSVKDGNNGNDENNENSSSPEIEFGSEIEIPGSVIEIPSGVSKPRPVFNNAVKHPTGDESYKTSTSISVSVSKNRFPTKAPTLKKTTTRGPTTRTTTTTERSTSTSTGSTSTTTTTPKPTKFPRLPTMPSYKKKTPVYARKNKNPSNSPFGKYSSSSSSSALAKEMNGSGEIVVITAGRSKVKEYKPQFIGDGSSSLLAFDKVAEGSSSTSSTNVVAEVTSTPSPSTSTTKSPLQEFDPMQLLHSWFTKSSD